MDDTACLSPVVSFRLLLTSVCFTSISFLLFLFDRLVLCAPGATVTEPFCISTCKAYASSSRSGKKTLKINLKTVL